MPTEQEPGLTASRGWPSGKTWWILGAIFCMACSTISLVHGDMPWATHMLVLAVWCKVMA